MTDEMLPARPADEIAAYRSAMGAAGPLLTADIAAFLQSGLTVALAAGEPGHATCALGIGCTVDATAPGTPLVRVFLDLRGNEHLLDMVRRGASVGATLTGLDHRSIQLKAAAGQAIRPGPGDLEALHLQVATHRDWLELLGLPRAYIDILTAFDDADVAGIAFRPERLYVQTPGPGAGSRLE